MGVTRAVLVAIRGMYRIVKSGKLKRRMCFEDQDLTGRIILKLNELKCVRM
jgi:hypothetical protein